jgi:hypothetical protein
MRTSHAATAAVSAAATLLSAALHTAPARAEAPPPALIGKSLVFTWQTRSSQIADGATETLTHNFDRIIYVSTEGRIFRRGGRAIVGTNRARRGDLPLGDPMAADGKRGDTRFEGGRLVLVQAFLKGAVRIVVGFDTGFRNWSLSAVFGRGRDGEMVRKGLDGKIHRIMSIELVSQSCAVQDGNALAGR